MNKTQTPVELQIKLLVIRDRFSFIDLVTDDIAVTLGTSTYNNGYLSVIIDMCYTVCIGV